MPTTIGRSTREARPRPRSWARRWLSTASIRISCCARRRGARATRLQLVLPELKTEPKVDYEDGLYHGTPQEMLDLLREVAPSASRSFSSGTIRSCRSFALDLIGSGAKHLKDRLEAKYPTAGLVVLRFQAGAWKDIAVNSGKLELFLTPRRREESSRPV